MRKGGETDSDRQEARTRGDEAEERETRLTEREGGGEGGRGGVRDEKKGGGLGRRRMGRGSCGEGCGAASSITAVVRAAVLPAALQLW